MLGVAAPCLESYDRVLNEMIYSYRCKGDPFSQGFYDILSSAHLPKEKILGSMLAHLETPGHAKSLLERLLIYAEDLERELRDFEEKRHRVRRDFLKPLEQCNDEEEKEGSLSTDKEFEKNGSSHIILDDLLRERKPEWRITDKHRSVWARFNSADGFRITTTELMKLTGVSRNSVLKVMNYLETLNIVVCDTNYSWTLIGKKR